MQTRPSYVYRDIKLVDGTYQSKSASLCDRCLHPACSNFAAMHCRDFTPAIKFKPPIRGFDNENVNTFRIGAAWSKRVCEGSMIALVNAKLDEVFAYAKVKSVFVGDKQELAELYGKHNHNIQALNVTQDIAATMLRRLKNASGTRAYDNTNLATVIYLEVISNERDSKQAIRGEG